MRKVLILGAGKIGSLIAMLLSYKEAYQVTLADKNPDSAMALMKAQHHQPLPVIHLDAEQEQALVAYLDSHPTEIIVSCLPYYCNPLIAHIARKRHLHYFDLTEDVSVMEQIKLEAKNADTIFMPQCGLAPGFISIVANNLMKQFDTVKRVKMRVGALPQNPSNGLKYSLTWSTDGLINEYGNTCHGIERGVRVPLRPLEGYETISVDGVLYEAFNTSGGLGTLAETYEGRVDTMDYKTIRYPGHCKKMHFLMSDLKLNWDRPTLKRILENAIPQTLQDVVLIYVAVTGVREGALFEENVVRKLYPQVIGGSLWSAIQITTAAGLCGVLDLLMITTPLAKGFLTQESISFTDFLQNRFGRYYAEKQ